MTMTLSDTDTKGQIPTQSDKDTHKTSRLSPNFNSSMGFVSRKKDTPVEACTSEAAPSLPRGALSRLGGPHNQHHNISLTRLLICTVILAGVLRPTCGDTSGDQQRHAADDAVFTVQPRSAENLLFAVETRQDALRYLQKYGYLNCYSNVMTSSTSTRPHNRVNSLRGRGQHVTQRASGQESEERTAARERIQRDGQGSQGQGSQVQGSRRCTERIILGAIKQFQQKYNLEQTGRLDVSTKRLMSRGRCGNTDKQSNYETPRRTFFVETEDTQMTSESDVNRRGTSTVETPGIEPGSSSSSSSSSSAAASRGHLRQGLRENSLDMLIEQQPMRDRRRSRIANRRRHSHGGVTSQSHGVPNPPDHDTRSTGRRAKRSVALLNLQDNLQTTTTDKQAVKPQDFTVTAVSQQHLQMGSHQSQTSDNVHTVHLNESQAAKELNPVEESQMTDASVNGDFDTDSEAAESQRLTMLKAISDKRNSDKEQHMFRLKTRLQKHGRYLRTKKKKVPTATLR